MTTDKNATRTLVSFIRAYTDVLEQNLQAIHVTMREAVEGVMQGINEISSKTAEKKQAANQVLVNTYTNPDDETRASMDSVQDEVNRVLELAASGTFEAAATPVAQGQAAAADDELRNTLRRSAGFFSKHMEALETLDGDLSNLLLQMMGALSRDDVIAQRIQHVQMSLNALQTSLTYILTDFEGRCRPGEVDRFIVELKSFTLRSYTMEDEKQLFYKVFPEERKAKKVAS